MYIRFSLRGSLRLISVDTLRRIHNVGFLADGTFQERSENQEKTGVADDIWKICVFECKDISLVPVKYVVISMLSVPN